MRKLGIIAVGVAVLGLTACSAGPSHAEVAKRFRIEYASYLGADPSTASSALDDLASSAADAALEGRCSNDGYRNGLINADADAAYLYAWDATCLLYFEHDMSQAQVTRAKRTIVEHVANG